MALPDQLAGKGLSSQEPIKGVAMGHGVTASMEAMHQGDRQRFKALSSKQVGQIATSARHGCRAIARLDGSGSQQRLLHRSKLLRRQRLQQQRQGWLKRHQPCPRLSALGHHDGFACMGGIDQASPHLDQARGHRSMALSEYLDVIR